MTPEILFGLPGKTALVTGGATGIDRMAAEALVRAGAHVLLASRKEGACAAVAEELNALDAPGSAEGFVGDVGTEEGYGQFPHKAWEKVMAVNVAGVFDLTQKLTPMLKASASPEDPARVVNVGSVMGEVPMGDGAYSYSASKAAVMHLTKILGKELAGDYITVNALAPGPFVSRMTAFATADEGMRGRVGDDVPLKRVGQPEDIAGCVLFLCGKGGSYVTGSIVPVSGGINVVTSGNIFEEAMH